MYVVELFCCFVESKKFEKISYGELFNSRHFTKNRKGSYSKTYYLYWCDQSYSRNQKNATL